MKFTISATIPVTQYGNIQPSIEIEADSYDEAYAEAMPKLEAIWNKYVEEGKQLGSARTKLTAFIGGEIYYDPIAHVYTNEVGEVYLSGSQYAKQFEKPFERDQIAGAIAKKFDADPKAIIDMWELKGEISRGFGTALHKALELYGRYDGLAKAIDKQTNLHDHPVIKKAVQGFYDAHKGEKAELEVMVVDHQRKHAGQIDRLLVTGDRKCRVQDYKTNATIEKSLPVYWKQLEFYGAILVAGGWVVEGLDIFHWDGTWHEYHKEI